MPVPCSECIFIFTFTEGERFMARLLHQVFSARMRKDGKVSLACGWFIGLFCGLCLSYCSLGSVSSLVRMAFLQPVSTVGLLGVIFLPLLISATTVFLSLYWFLPILAGVKAFSFAFVMRAVCQAFASGYPLAYAMLCFSEMCTIPLLILFWLRYANGRIWKVGEIAAYFAVAAVIFCTDYWVISPFVAGL